MESNQSTSLPLTLQQKLDNYVAQSFQNTAQNPRFVQVKKVVKALTYSALNPRFLIDILDSGPIFLSAKQAREVMNLIEVKSQRVDYRYHHVLCGRVLDFWNIYEHYDHQVGFCYYAMDRPLPPHATLGNIIGAMSKHKESGCNWSLVEAYSSYCSRIIENYCLTTPMNDFTISTPPITVLLPERTPESISEPISAIIPEPIPMVIPESTPEPQIQRLAIPKKKKPVYEKLKRSKRTSKRPSHFDDFYCW